MGNGTSTSKDIAQPQDAFTPEKSRITEASLERWRNAEVNGELTQVPGVGEATAIALKKRGISNSYELMGRFMSYMGEEGLLTACTDFKQFLAECDTPSTFRDSVVLAIGEKLASGITVLGLEVTEAILSSSQMQQADMESFLAKDLSGDPKMDFKGIGDKSKKALAKQGCETTWQLLGDLLTSCDPEAFQQHLNEAGVAPGWQASITHQCVERLANGLKLPVDC